MASLNDGLMRPRGSVAGLSNAASPGPHASAAWPRTTSACPRPSSVSTLSPLSVCCSNELVPYFKFITRSSRGRQFWPCPS